jgi:ABC-2 type transport system ATP-binding protein
MGRGAAGTATDRAAEDAVMGRGAEAAVMNAVDNGAMDAAVATHSLTKRFRGGQVAVDQIDLVVPWGAVYGFLGPNGSGKTTTIRMLLGLISPTAGRVELLGRPMPRAAAAVLPRTGALVEGPAFHPYLSGWANLARLDAADRIADPATAKDRIGAALDRVGLIAAARKRYRAYSLGMRQRLAIAAGLLQPRDLLVLDEPTNGLDPQGTREVRSLIGQLAADGTTVLVSSHLLAEVEQVCSHVGIMHRGKLVAQDSLERMQARAEPRIRVETADPDLALAACVQFGLSGVDRHGYGVTAPLGAAVPEEVCAALVRAGVPVRGFAVDSADLEDVFVALTGEGFDVSG